MKFHRDRNVYCNQRRGGRVVECTGLENRRGASHRGFESHPLCHFLKALYLKRLEGFLFLGAREVSIIMSLEHTRIKMVVKPLYAISL